MANLQELEHHGRIENFQTPQAVEPQILQILGTEFDRDHVTMLRGGMYIPSQHPDLEEVLAYTDDIRAALLTRTDIVENELYAQLVDHAETLTPDAVTLAKQLRSLSPIMTLITQGKNTKAAEAFEDEEFKKEFGIADVHQPLSIFRSESPIKHPFVQATMLRLFRMRNGVRKEQMVEIKDGADPRKITADEIFKTQLALRWYFLPHDQPYAIHAITSNLSDIGIAWVKSKRDDMVEQAIPIFQVAADYADAAGLASAYKHLENASLNLIAVGRPKEAVRLSSEALEMADKRNIKAEEYSIIQGNHLINVSASMREDTAQSINDWDLQALKLSMQSDLCEAHDKFPSAIELRLAAYDAYTRAGNVEMATMEKQVAIRLSQDSRVKMADVFKNLHPGVETQAAEIFPQ